MINAQLTPSQALNIGTVHAVFEHLEKKPVVQTLLITYDSNSEFLLLLHFKYLCALELSTYVIRD